MERKLLGGRFRKALAKEALRFLAEEDIEWDSRLVEEDVTGSEAHAIMLWHAGIISKEELKAILKVLEKVKVGYRQGRFKLSLELVDVHLNIEQLMIKEVGMDIGGKLHTGRSRNDQILLDLRLYLREEIIEISIELVRLIETFLGLASRHLLTVMPGYTHLQHAQPTTLAHWLNAYSSMFLRDLQRLENSFKLVNQNPLGACALIGTSWPINRKETSQLLGFDGVQENSMDVITSRGEDLYDLLSALSILAVHLSRLSEDLILWGSYEFRMIELDDAYCTGSSIMPQKKNPDVVEVIRSKASTLISHLLLSLILMKSLPSGYFKDLQETKPSIFKAAKIARKLLTITRGIISTMKINKERMLELSTENFATATDLADLLTRKNKIPFRLSHKIVGLMVKNALEAGKKPSQIVLEDVKMAASKVLDEDITITEQELNQTLNSLKSIQSKCSLGSPNPKEISRMNRENAAKTKEALQAIIRRKKKIENSEKSLQLLVNKIIHSN